MIGQLLPNLVIYENIVSSHLSQQNFAHVAAENKDDLSLVLPLDHSVVILSADRKPVLCLPGEAVLMPAGSIHHAINLNTISIALIFASRTRLASGLYDLNNYLAEKICSASAPGLRLIIGYTKMLIKMKDELSPELASLASIQINDLLTQLLGAMLGKAEVTQSSNLRAARLKAIKIDILEHIADNELSIHQVALRQRISSQYIRALFHNEETTFADYVTKMRLEHVYRLLCNPLHIGSSISTIAFNLGFNNLSWFNRVFKQRYGLTPKQIRELIQQSLNQPQS